MRMEAEVGRERRIGSEGKGRGPRPGPQAERRGTPWKLQEGHRPTDTWFWVSDL